MVESKINISARRASHRKIIVNDDNSIN